MSSDTKAQKLSLHMEDFIGAIEDSARSLVNADVSVVLCLGVSDVMLYGANIAREEGKDVLYSLLARWNAKGADIPAFCNPEVLGTYRVLTMQDTVTHGDEMLQDNAVMWTPVRESYLGKEFKPGWFPPMRRKVIGT